MTAVGGRNWNRFKNDDGGCGKIRGNALQIECDSGEKKFHSAIYVDFSIMFAPILNRGETQLKASFMTRKIPSEFRFLSTKMLLPRELF